MGNSCTGIFSDLSGCMKLHWTPKLMLYIVWILCKRKVVIISVMWSSSLTDSGKTNDCRQINRNEKQVWETTQVRPSKAQISRVVCVKMNRLFVAQIWSDQKVLKFLSRVPENGWKYNNVSNRLSYATTIYTARNISINRAPPVFRLENGHPKFNTIHSCCSNDYDLKKTLLSFTSSLISEYHDLYELQRKRLESLVGKCYVNCCTV